MDYLVNDRKTRLNVLAGLVDTDGGVRAKGHEIRISQGERNYQIIHDAEFLARSLGFSCHVNDGVCTYSVNGEKRQRPYKELTITGKNLFEIPTVLPRKKLNKFDNPVSIKKCSSYLQSSFELVKKDIQPFVGFQLEGNGRFLLGDMVISHNTPEGASVGLVKNMSMSAGITISSNSTNIRTVLREAGIVEFDGTNISIFQNETKVIVNGDIIGIHEDPVTLYQTLKTLKRNGAINIYTGISWNIQKNEMNINSEGGRCVRPLYIVEGNKANLLESFDKMDKYSWKDLILNSMVEYLDVEETNYALIAMKPYDLVKGDKGANKQPNYTHLEIHPSLMLGVLAGNIPFSDHNQAPRNTYQCLGINETVLMANGEKKKIKDVCIGDEVITFDPKTMYPTVTKVIHQYVRPTENKIYEIETISGRKIIATSNHNFMTTEGWQPVEKFKLNETKIGVFMNPEPVSTQVEDYLVLDDSMFKERLKSFGMKDKLIAFHTNKIKQIGLLPLRSTHPKLPVLAGLIGVAATDGTINIYNKKHGGMTGQFSANFGTEYDANVIEEDIKSLGFDTTTPLEQIRQIHGATHHTWRVAHNGALPSLLIALQPIVIGKKTETPRNGIPHWIMNGSKMVKREYLSAYQGGDGCLVQINKNYKTGEFVSRSAVTSQSIVPKYKETLVHFMEDMITLCKEFDIEMIGIKEFKGKYDKVCVGYKVRDTQSNLINLFERIGYKYCCMKQRESGVAVEFLKYKLLNQIKLTEYDNWKQNVTYQGNSIFVPIKSVTEVENQLISDITVEHDNHSFIAGDNFLSSNSAMGKQAIGVYASNFRHRFDTMAHVLNYPQKPIVETNLSKLINTSEMPCGFNVMVAIMTYTGLTMC
jgi:intein/homing endonuclease